MRKRFLVLTICLALVFCLTACGDDEPVSGKHKNKDNKATPVPADTTETDVFETAGNKDADDGWKQAYINYLKGIAAEDDTYNLEQENFALVDIDGDGIPELYDDHGTTAAGAELFTYNNGNIESLYMYTYGLKYIEGKNLFRDLGGHMDEYYDDIYCIENGKFVLLYSGNYGAEDNSNLQFDENGEPIYKYYWEGTEVSFEDYNKMLNSVYDTKEETDPYNEELMYDYDEIFDVIENYIG